MQRIITLCLLGLWLVACKDQAEETVSIPLLKDQKIIAYVHGLEENWGEKDMEARKITHINFAFANIKDGKVIEGHEDDALAFVRLNELKKANPELKILISVGGWSWSKNFSDAALTPESREIFANSALDFMQRHKIDGIDLDWEYPGLPGDNNVHRPEDKENFTALLKLIRKKLDALGGDKEHYLLTIATGASQRYLDHTEMDEAQKYLDFINIMTYDYYGGGPSTGHHANLYPSDSEKGTKRSASISVDQHINAGIPVEKLVLGFPFYGKGRAEVNPENNGLYQPTSGKLTWLSYRVIKDSLVNKNGYKRMWDSSAKTPYLWNEETAGFVTYEDVESFKIKVDYIKEKGMGGAMFWQYNQDTEDHELLNTLYDNLIK